MDLSIASTAVVRVCGALPRFASTCFKCFKSLHAHNAAKRNYGLIVLTIAEQLERYAQSCASLGEDNAVALHSDDPYPHVICA